MIDTFKTKKRIKSFAQEIGMVCLACPHLLLVPTISTAGVYLSEGRHPIIPVFQYSNIPIAERSGAKFYFTNQSNFQR